MTKGLVATIGIVLGVLAWPAIIFSMKSAIANGEMQNFLIGLSITVSYVLMIIFVPMFIRICEFFYMNNVFSLIKAFTIIESIFLNIFLRIIDTDEMTFFVSFIGIPLLSLILSLVPAFLVACLFKTYK